jgi:hypothetical protein
MVFEVAGLSAATEQRHLFLQDSRTGGSREGMQERRPADGCACGLMYVQCLVALASLKPPDTAITSALVHTPLQPSGTRLSNAAAMF